MSIAHTNMPEHPPTDQLFEALRGGDRAALGRAITLVESRKASDKVTARRLLDRCLPFAGKALRLGITGIPGVGKSTLIDTLGMHLIGSGHHVAVLAVDPSSSRSGGSILGDKTRMDRLSRAEEAFIRPTAAGGNLGGVGRSTREAMLFCEAAGYDRILVETVGTGQNELEVDHITDLNLLLMIAGAGDELQGIKRGIMESADLIAITKADGDGAARAQHAKQELGNAITLLPVRDSGRHPQVLLTSALTGNGIPELVELLEAFHAEDLASGRVQHRRVDQDLHWMQQVIAQGLLAIFTDAPGIQEHRALTEAEVRAGRLSPFRAAEQLLERFRTGDAPLP